jgi:hypothetical protein
LSTPRSTNSHPIQWTTIHPSNDNGDGEMSNP